MSNEIEPDVRHREFARPVAHLPATDVVPLTPEEWREAILSTVVTQQ